MRRILLAYDGSDGARRALEEVVGLAREGDAVTIVGVAEGTPLFGYAGSLPSPEQERERQSQLEEAAAALREHGISASLVRKAGDPAAAILDVAESEGSDIVVMGTRGLSTAERWLLGSVSTKILHHARCSVLVAR